MNIIVTGASQGIGYETALRLSSQSSNQVIAISRNQEKLQKLKEKSDSRIYTIPFDLKDFDKYSFLLAEVTDFCDQVDVLINNAGKLECKNFEDFTISEIQSIFDVNFLAPSQLIKALLPLFNPIQSHVINISSMGGFQGASKFPGLAYYSASKGAISTLTECLAEELKEKNISVNCLALGAVQTEMLANAFPGYEAPVSAESMADFISKFAMEGHRFFNGKIIPVNISTP